MTLRDTIKKLPYPLSQLLRKLYGYIPQPIRYGKLFRDTYNFLQESQWWSREKLEEYQMQQLEKLLCHAYKNVPYYRRVFDEKGLKPKDIQDFDDLKKLPYLTKEIIRKNLPELIARNYQKSQLHYLTTGGTTCTPLGIYWEKGVTQPKEMAFMWRQFNWGGYRFSDKSVTFRGDVFYNVKDGKRQIWKYNPAWNEMYFSPFDMTDENLFHYANKINKFEPVAMEAYPSCIYILTNFLKKNNLTINTLKSIFTSSETLYPHQREVIEGYLGIKILDAYGNTERNAMIMNCEKGGYHIISEYGIIELIGSNDESITDEDTYGEIIGTGFINYAMPFIRYKTDDIGVYTQQRQCPCGKHLPLLKRLEGRVQEFIIAKDGSLIPLVPAIFGIHDAEWTNIKQIQCVQEKTGHLILQLVKHAGYSDAEIEKYVLNLFNARLEGKCDLKVKFLEDIPLTERGKYKFLIQKLPINFRSTQES